MNQLTVISTDFIDRADLAASTKIKYRKSIQRAQKAGVNFGDHQSVVDYVADLLPSQRRLLKSAINIWAEEIELQAQAGSTPDTALTVLAIKDRLEATKKVIKVKQPKGAKSHTWLSQSQVKKMLGYPNIKTPKGLRDKVILGLMVAAGLRREEIVTLTFADIKRQPVKGRMRTVLDVSGKGSKNRVVPINERLAEALNQWAEFCGNTGNVARSVTRGGMVNGSLSAVGIFKIVNAAGEEIGMVEPKLAPHDLRRTYAQLGYEAGVSITQISTLLGHASVATTQRYLNLELDLENTVSDFIPFD